MSNRTRQLRPSAIRVALAQTVLWATFSAAQPASAQPSTASAPAVLASRSWQVRYMGGPAGLARGTKVRVHINRDRVVYQSATGRKKDAFFIPTPEVSDVSGELIAGTLAEKVFGPDDLDYVDALGVGCPQPDLADPVRGGFPRRSRAPGRCEQAASAGARGLDRLDQVPGRDWSRARARGAFWCRDVFSRKHRLSGPLCANRLARPRRGRPRSGVQSECPGLSGLPGGDRERRESIGKARAAGRIAAGCWPGLALSPVR
jgi:hypothetical protein